MRVFAARLRSQRGASAVEALFVMGAMLAMLLIVTNIGGAFWNLSVLNNMTQSASQTSQFLMDRSCTPGQVPLRTVTPGQGTQVGNDPCSKAYDRALTQSNRIIDQQDNGLVMVGGGCGTNRDSKVRARKVQFIDGRPVLGGAPSCSKTDDIDVQPVSPNSFYLPDGTTCLPAGWGYSSAAVSMPFRFWAGSFLGINKQEITLGSAAMTASYVEPREGALGSC